MEKAADSFLCTYVSRFHQEIWAYLLVLKRICQCLALRIRRDVLKQIIQITFEGVAKTGEDSHVQPVLMIPEEPAVIARDKILSYLQLNEQANRIAHSLNLVDRFMQPVPVGIKGELCVAGGFVWSLRRLKRQLPG